MVTVTEENGSSHEVKPTILFKRGKLLFELLTLDCSSSLSKLGSDNYGFRVYVSVRYIQVRPIYQRREGTYMYFTSEISFTRGPKEGRDLGS